LIEAFRILIILISILDLGLIVTRKKIGESFPTGLSFTFGLLALLLLELILVIDKTYNVELGIIAPLILLIGITKWCLKYPELKPIKLIKVDLARPIIPEITIEIPKVSNPEKIIISNIDKKV
jgi:hypothetical protein